MRDIKELVSKILLNEITDDDMTEEEKKLVMDFIEKESKEIEKETKKAQKEKEKSLKRIEKLNKANEKLDKLIEKESK
ncbi:MAG: hypothetical protein J6A15_09655 [Clostridia bacterium]|nr:hypothetical protein [Clostridia bacterium]